MQRYFEALCPRHEDLDSYSKVIYILSPLAETLKIQYFIDTIILHISKFKGCSIFYSGYFLLIVKLFFDISSLNWQK
jgi:uncharacterized membrane protein